MSIELSDILFGESSQITCMDFGSNPSDLPKGVWVEMVPHTSYPSIASTIHSWESIFFEKWNNQKVEVTKKYIENQLFTLDLMLKGLKLPVYNLFICRDQRMIRGIMQLKDGKDSLEIISLITNPLHIGLTMIDQALLYHVTMRALECKKLFVSVIPLNGSFQLYHENNFVEVKGSSYWVRALER